MDHATTVPVTSRRLCAGVHDAGEPAGDRVLSAKANRCAPAGGTACIIGEPVFEEYTAAVGAGAEQHRLERQAFCLEAGEMVARESHRVWLIREAAAISSGTLATLTGFSRYDQIDPIQVLFVQWCQDLPAARLARILTWQEAWACFWEHATCDTSVVTIDALP